MIAPRPPERACDRCLRRSLLLARLAPHIERVATGRPGSRGRELLALDDDALTRAVASAKAESLLADASLRDAAGLRRALDATGCWVTCRHAAGYPPGLRDLGGEAPAALMGRGDAGLLQALDERPGVTVVGSRRSRSYGTTVARDLGHTLAAAGLTVISGLALGVDAAAHRGTLEGGGRTIAVLGSGPDRAYPPSNARLYERILESGGAVISELPPGTGAFRWTFPARNRLMAALGAMTVVVEAAARSGSLITAEMAQQLGRDVGAVPGPVNSWLSEGANALIADGAVPVRDAGDVLDRLLGTGVRAAPGAGGPPLDEELAAALGAVEAGHRSADDVAVALGAAAASAGAALARLELLGYVEADVTGAYARTGLARPSS